MAEGSKAGPSESLAAFSFDLGLSSAPNVFDLVPDSMEVDLGEELSNPFGDYLGFGKVEVVAVDSGAAHGEVGVGVAAAAAVDAAAPIVLPGAAAVHAALIAMRELRMLSLQQGLLSVVGLVVGLRFLLQPPSLLVGLHLIEMQPGLLEVVVWGFRPLGLLVVEMGALLKIFGRLLLCLHTPWGLQQRRRCWVS
jgi:hypothetical protein